MPEITITQIDDKGKILFVRYKEGERTNLFAKAWKSSASKFGTALEVGATAVAEFEEKENERDGKPETFIKSFGGLKGGSGGGGGFRGGGGQAWQPKSQAEVHSPSVCGILKSAIENGLDEDRARKWCNLYIEVIRDLERTSPALAPATSNPAPAATAPASAAPVKDTRPDPEKDYLLSVFDENAVKIWMTDVKDRGLKWRELAQIAKTYKLRAPEGLGALLEKPEVLCGKLGLKDPQPATVMARMEELRLDPVGVLASAIENAAQGVAAVNALISSFSMEPAK